MGALRFRDIAVDDGAVLGGTTDRLRVHGALDHAEEVVEPRWGVRCLYSTSAGTTNESIMRRWCSVDMPSPMSQPMSRMLMEVSQR